DWFMENGRPVDRPFSGWGHTPSRPEKSFEKAPIFLVILPTVGKYMLLYHFGPFVLDPHERRLVCGGELVSLTPTAFDLLVYLLEHRGHLIGKDELMEAIWKDSHVEEGNLSRTIHVLRRVLGQGDTDAKYIETVPTKGYRFVALVAEVNSPKGTPAPLES